MRSCWEEEPSDRPNFTQLRMVMEDLLTEDRNYLVLEDIDVPLTNSDNSSSPSPPPSSSADSQKMPLCPSGCGAVGGLHEPHSQLDASMRHHLSQSLSQSQRQSSLIFEPSSSILSTVPSSKSATMSHAHSSQSIPTSTHKAKKTSPRRDNLCIKVRIHQDSTDRLIRPSESDSSPSSCWTFRWPLIICRSFLH